MSLVHKVVMKENLLAFSSFKTAVGSLGTMLTIMPNGANSLFEQYGEFRCPRRIDLTAFPC